MFILIYLITNKINNKKYIGQTIKTLDERIVDYYREYQYRTDCERPIIRAMRKYGFDNFIFEIVEDNIKTQEELDSKEIYYIELYQTQVSHGIGYNLKFGGFGGKHAEETKIKIGEAQKGELNHMYGRTGVLNPKSKSVLELTTGQQYESANLASIKNNISFSHICACARGERGSTGGLVFRYIENGKPIRPNNPAKIKSKTTKDKVLPQYKYLL